MKIKNIKHIKIKNKRKEYDENNIERAFRMESAGHPGNNSHMILACDVNFGHLHFSTASTQDISQEVAGLLQYSHFYFIFFFVCLFVFYILYLLQHSACCQLYQTCLQNSFDCFAIKQLHLLAVAPHLPSFFGTWIWSYGNLCCRNCNS